MLRFLIGAENARCATRDVTVGHRPASKWQGKQLAFCQNGFGWLLALCL